MTAVTTTLLLVCASVGGAPQNVLLDFSATWCGPCQQMKPYVLELEREGLPVINIDVDQHPDLARRFNVRSIPAFILLINGRVVDRVTGITSPSRLRAMALQAQRAREQQLAALQRARQRSQASQSRVEANPGVPVASTSTSTPPAAQAVGTVEPMEPSAGTTTTEPEGTTSRGARGVEQPVVRASSDTLPSGGHSQLTDPDLASCVRIRVQDKSGVSYGSRTVIASRPGASLILTCGHVFRDLDSSSKIKVDVFQGERVETFDGKIICYDLEADVGLMTIPSLLQLPTVPVAPRDYKLHVGDPVVSFGCSGGEPPTRQTVRITALNRYLGPDNIECTGVPIQGRSGGGLLNTRGEVVGVCIAADPQEQRGLYAGLQAIHDLLVRADLEYLFEHSKTNTPAQLAQAETTEGKGVSSRSLSQRSPADAVPAEAATVAAHNSPNTAESDPAHSSGSFQRQVPSEVAEVAAVARSRSNSSLSQPQQFLQPKVLKRSSTAVASANLSTAPAMFNTNSPQTQVLRTAEEVQQLFEQTGAAEVVCIVRPLNNTQGPSRVVIIRRASPKFVADLLGEMRHNSPTTPAAVASLRSEPASFQPASLNVKNQQTAFDQLQMQRLRVERFQRQR